MWPTCFVSVDASSPRCGKTRADSWPNSAPALSRSEVTGASVVRKARGLLPGRADLAAMRRDPLNDLVAGLTVAVVALPLALAFGAISGLGARSGIVTAVIAGLVAAIFGGSNL